MAGVDHDGRADAGLFGDSAAAASTLCGVVVGGLAAAQDDVAVVVAGGRGDGGAAGLGDREEMVRLAGRFHRVERDADVAVGAVLEADRAGEAGGQLAVDLALGGARADGAPGDEVGEVLRRGHVEEFAAGGQAEIVDVEQQRAGEAQAVVDVEAAVEVGVVDQALPADGGARLLEIDAHDDLEPVAEAFAERGEAAGVVERGVGIVDGAGADDDDEAVVGAVEDVVEGVARR